MTDPQIDRLLAALQRIATALENNPNGECNLYDRTQEIAEHLDPISISLASLDKDGISVYQ